VLCLLSHDNRNALIFRAVKLRFIAYALSKSYETVVEKFCSGENRILAHTSRSHAIHPAA
jgi:lysozyme family protein